MTCGFLCRAQFGMEGMESPRSLASPLRRLWLGLRTLVLRQQNHLAIHFIGGLKFFDDYFEDLLQALGSSFKDFLASIRA
ncbi:Hypothetical protein FKW44_018842 [Caligus rogercresseyi]|uniref:Uncharacterized protein n=1 Tax=Caligus rogercresseyi TaxID=217165 RepID=A0A7T8GUZ6_CALRO|nr:Hypothetical protein FKW44_018842 [Caligus rogercresseyi]